MGFCRRCRWIITGGLFGATLLLVLAGWWGVPRISQAVTYTTYLYTPNGYSNKVSGYSVNTSTGAVSAISGSPFSASGGLASRGAATPDGKYLYVTHYVSNGTTIQRFSINASTGALSSLGTTASGSQEPTDVAVTPNGSYLYVTSTNAAMISRYSINNSTGALTSLGTTSLASGAYPTALTVSADGSYLYTANQGTGTISGFTIGGDGSLSEISGSPWTNDPSAGCGTAGCAPTSLSITPSGSFFFVGNNYGNVTAYSVSSGALTKFTGGSPTGTITTDGGVNDIAISNDSKYLYATQCGSVSGFDITSANGTIASITSLGSTTTSGCGNPQHIGVSSAGSFLYTGNDGEASFREFSINTSTGALTEVSESPFSTQTLAADFAFAQVPAQPSVSFTASTQSGAESVGTLTITAQLSDTYTDTVTIPFTMTGTATGGGTDYSITASPITITAGNTTADITMTVTDDALDEDDETVVVTMGSPTNATQGATTVHTATITDNDSPPTVQFSAATSSGSEGTTPAVITVTLSGASGKTVTVEYATANGTATAGSDYTSASGTLTFAPGDVSEDVSVSITDDGTDEEDETFTVTLANPLNALLGGTTTHTYTIADNDGEPTIGFAASSSSGGEQTTPASLSVTLSPASAKTVTVEYATANGTATAGSDYTSASGTLTFDPGETSKSVSVTIADDALDEEDETFTATLSNPTNTTLSVVTTHTYTITDNDDPPTAQFTAATSSGAETATPATFTVSLSAASAKTVTVQYATANGTATAGTDYTAASGTLTFTPSDTSEEVSASILNDTTHEESEEFTIALTSPSNASLGSASTHTYMITDDDPAGSRVGDTTPPAAPSSIVASATATTVTFTWADPLDQDLGAIDVLRNTPPSTAISGNPISTVAKGVHQFIDATVQPATAYVYALRARDNSGNSRNSDPIAVTTLEVAAPTPVNVPVNAPPSIVNAPVNALPPIVNAPVEPTREDRLVEAKAELPTILPPRTLDVLPTTERDALELFLATGEPFPATQALAFRERANLVEAFGRIFARPPRTEIERAAFPAMVAERPQDIPDLATHLRNLEAKIPAFANLHGRYPGDGATTPARVEEDWRALRVLAYGVTEETRDIARERQTLRSLFRRAFVIVFDSTHVFKSAGAFPSMRGYTEFFRLIRSCVYGNPDACMIGR